MISSPIRRLRDKEAFNDGTIYQADCDCFVVAIRNPGELKSVIIHIGTTTPPSSTGGADTGRVDGFAQAVAFVPKGYYWKTTDASGRSLWKFK